MRCYEYACSEEGVLTVTLDNGQGQFDEIECNPETDNGQLKSSTVFSVGTLKCPQDIEKFCSGTSLCKYNCNNNGFCVDGLCNCNGAYIGTYCGYLCGAGQVVQGTSCANKCDSRFYIGRNR